MKDKITVFCDSALDYKYKSIFGRMNNIRLVSGSWGRNLLGMIRDDGKKIYHFRYIKFRGYLFTIIRMAATILISKLTRTKIVWSCHNIEEHTFQSEHFNSIMRTFLCMFSSEIIVFHVDLIVALPKWCRNKISVACFGNMYDSFSSNRTENQDFVRSYTKWRTENDVNTLPNLVSISTAKRNDLEPLFNLESSSKLNAMVISPGVKYETRDLNKCFLFSKSPVRKEVFEILTENAETIVGYVGHNNMSVPTSIYMYASFGIPLICSNYAPSSSG